MENENWDYKYLNILFDYDGKTITYKKVFVDFSNIIKGEKFPVLGCIASNDLLLSPEEGMEKLGCIVLLKDNDFISYVLHR